MSKHVEFKLNLAGLNELMKSDEMKACLREGADAVAEASGIECGIDVHDGTWTSLAHIYPANEEAAIENYHNNSLLKGLGGVGLHAEKGGG